MSVGVSVCKVHLMERYAPELNDGCKELRPELSVEAGSCDGRRDEADEVRDKQIVSLFVVCALSTASQKLVNSVWSLAPSASSLVNHMTRPCSFLAPGPRLEVLRH